MRLWEFFVVFITTDTVLVCVSGPVLSTDLDVENRVNNQRTWQSNKSKIVREEDKFVVDQVTTDINFTAIINQADTSPASLFNSKITLSHFSETQNVSEIGEGRNTVTGSWNSSEKLLTFSRSSNLSISQGSTKNSDIFEDASSSRSFDHSNANSQHQPIDAFRNIYEPNYSIQSGGTETYTNLNSSNIYSLIFKDTYLKINIASVAKEEGENTNNYIKTRLLETTKSQEESNTSSAHLSIVPTLPAIPDLWYDILIQNFTCFIQQNEGLNISCSNISLYEISGFLPIDTMKLDISNCMQVLLLKPLFPHLKKLRSLKLSNNHHRYITRAFMGLDTLENLDLSKNDIVVVKDAFTFIPKLKTLDLSENHIIRIGTIASALKTLTHLENLTLDLNTDIRQILNKELEPLKNAKLVYLGLFNTTIEIIEKNALKNLPYLKVLDLSVNYVNEDAMANLTSSLNNTSIKFLFMRQLVLLNSFPYEALSFLQNTTIYRLDLAYNFFPNLEIFPYIPSLVSLWLSSCSIKLIRDNAFAELPNLRELVINGHELITFPVGVVTVKNLKILSLDNQMSLSGIPFIMQDFALENMTHLELLTLSNVPMKGKFSRHTLFGLNNLKFLSLRATVLSDIEEFAFESLISLEILDIQGNILRYLRTYTFFGLRNLKYLYLNRNKLIFPEEYLPFHQLPLLKELHIVDNKIDTLPNQVFSTLTNLESLFLSRNKIVPWNSRIFPPNLNITVFDLSENQITHITSAMLTDFGQVSEYLDLSKNPFNCSACGMKDFQAFFRYSNLTFSLPRDTRIDKLSYTCTEPVSFQNKPFEDVELPVVNCDVEEAALINLLAIALICFIIFFVTLISSLCYLFRWYIRYWMFQVQARMKERKCSQSYEHQYVYDAFISYNSANTPWVVSYLIPMLEVQEPKFKLCIHERDFQVGSLITENILGAIDASRKVILVLSERFIKSEWCMFELHMAQHKLFDDTRDSLILIKLEGINKKLYTKNLLYLEKTRLCLEWTENMLGQKLFWERIRKALGLPISKKDLTSDGVDA